MGVDEIRLVVLVVLALIVVRFFMRQRVRFLQGTTLVLRRFHFDDNASAKTVLEIAGRPSGIIGFLLTLLKIDPDYELTVTDSAVSIRATSLSGLYHFYVPLRCVASTACGYQRSIWALALAILFGVSFLYSFLTTALGNPQSFASSESNYSLFLLLAAALFAAIYALSKKIGISVETTGGEWGGVVFKRSIIENLSVDLPQALRAVAAVNARVLAAPSLPVAMGRLEESVSGGTGPVRCPQCSASNPAGTRFCENCGSALS